MASALAAADDGRDVFQHIPTEWTEIRAWARHLLPPPGEAVALLTVIRAQVDMARKMQKIQRERAEG
ncbi:hypothetical protein [Streptomyces huasconensis]|uniref:hypothetical protein n=1 Tax=Streptomyces huasconensis TaxID=1854574 RepID=UPI0033CBF14E